VRQRGLTSVEVHVGDVENLDLPAGTADAVTASMVLFFLPELERGLQRLHALLKPGGWFAFTVFGDADPRWRPVYEAFLPFLPELEPDEDLSRPRHPALATVDGICATVERAGFTEVRCLDEVHPVRFASVEQWLQWSWSCGLRGAWLEIPEDRRLAARDAVLAEVERRRDDAGDLVEDFAIRIVLARRT
jgi:SAM-dependent methyltransferase